MVCSRNRKGPLPQNLVAKGFSKGFWGCINDNKSEFVVATWVAGVVQLPSQIHRGQEDKNS